MTYNALNLIIVTSDELRGDCVGFAGRRDVRTPHLDRFAAGGVVFEQHFAVHGKCVPSRIAIATGRYTHTDGFRSIHQHLPPNQPSLLSLVKAAGYETAVFGHNHVWENFFGNNHKSSGVVDYHSYTYEGGFRELLERRWPVPPARAGAVPPPAALDNAHFHYLGRITNALEGFCDDNRAEQAIHYLRRVRDRSRPFFLQLNFSAPHPPYQVEEPWFSLYDRETIARWPVTLPAGAPLPLQAMRRVRTAAADSEALFREIQAVYYGMVSKMDELFGRVWNAIESEGLLDNTVVLFTSDHGDFAGQYGLVEKWDTAMHDCILHVPLALRAPGLPAGARVTGLTEHVDVLPTLAELLGLPPNWGVHGESLLPMVRGERRKEAVFADGGHEPEMWARRPRGETLDGKQKTYRDYPEAMARTKMVRTDRYKLVIRLAGGNELYDLAEDPWELRNRWGDPALNAVMLDLQHRMIEWCLRTDTDRPMEERVLA